MQVRTVIKQSLQVLEVDFVHEVHFPMNTEQKEQP